MQKAYPSPASSIRAVLKYGLSPIKPLGGGDLKTDGPPFKKIKILLIKKLINLNLFFIIFITHNLIIMQFDSNIFYLNKNYMIL